MEGPTGLIARFTPNVPMQDVAAAYPRAKTALVSGFEVRLNLDAASLLTPVKIRMKEGFRSTGAWA